MGRERDAEASPTASWGTGYHNSEADQGCELGRGGRLARQFSQGRVQRMGRDYLNSVLMILLAMFFRDRWSPGVFGMAKVYLSSLDHTAL